MTRLNQEQLEIRMAEVGYAKTQANIAAAEARGAADQTPYAATVYRDYVQPLADLVQKAQATKGPAANAAHVALLRPLDPWLSGGVAASSLITAWISSSYMLPRTWAR